MGGEDSPNDPQRYHAWVQVEKAWPEHRYGATEEDPKLRLNVGLELLEELVKFLAEVDPQAQAALKPHLVPFATRLEQRYAA